MSTPQNIPSLSHPCALCTDEFSWLLPNGNTLVWCKHVRWSGEYITAERRWLTHGPYDSFRQFVAEVWAHSAAQDAEHAELGP